MAEGPVLARKAVVQAESHAASWLAQSLFIVDGGTGIKA
jgi:hypothetical protein